MRVKMVVFPKQFETWPPLENLVSKLLGVAGLPKNARHCHTTYPSNQFVAVYWFEHESFPDLPDFYVHQWKPLTAKQIEAYANSENRKS